MITIAYQIERLIAFALNKEIISKEDVSFTRNQLIDLLHVNEPYSFAEGEITEEYSQTATSILTPILDYCAEKGLIPDNTVTFRDLMDSRIMGLLMSRPSDIRKTFLTKMINSPKQATDWFYTLNQSVNYIQVDRISKNLYWETNTDFGNMEITINLSKPEKDPKDIIAARQAAQNSGKYPKCLLCAENEGFAGNANHPGRQNLRLIPFEMENEEWFFQYSPYVYYNEHCIVLNKKHTPMDVSVATFRRLFSFIDKMPHYFIGSNAGLPIVGGSILTHDHYQGGRHVFPMEKAEVYAKYKHPRFERATISLVKWPMPVVRIAAKDKETVINVSEIILKTWESYNDESADIHAFSGEIPHNAITPIARKNKNNEYEMDIVLRNNRTTEQHPMGIFHPHNDLHHIKKENIGLIEVMGLAVLPGRLSVELVEIGKILTGETTQNHNAFHQAENPLFIHADWINELIELYGTVNDKNNADAILKAEVGKIFTKVLSDASVFKFTAEGKNHFRRFIKACGMTIL